LFLARRKGFESLTSNKKRNRSPHR